MAYKKYIQRCILMYQRRSNSVFEWGEEELYY